MRIQIVKTALTVEMAIGVTYRLHQYRLYYSLALQYVIRTNLAAADAMLYVYMYIIICWLVQ